jgi:hypothetical protein
VTEYRLELDVLPDMVPAECHGDLPMFREAIEAVRAGDEDRLMTFPGEPEPFARAYQVVAVFDLTAFTLPRHAPMEDDE